MADKMGKTLGTRLIRCLLHVAIIIDAFVIL